jgi:hypothetical protein
MKLQRVGGPGLKSETWAAHSTFVRASFIVLTLKGKPRNKGKPPGKPRDRGLGTFGAPKRSKCLISIPWEQVREAGHAIEYRTDGHQPIILPGQMGSYARPGPIRRIPREPAVESLALREPKMAAVTQRRPLSHPGSANQVLHWRQQYRKGTLGCGS